MRTEDYKTASENLRSIVVACAVVRGKIASQLPLSERINFGIHILNQVLK